MCMSPDLGLIYICIFCKIPCLFQLCTFVEQHYFSQISALKLRFLLKKNMNWLRFYSEYLSKNLVGGGSDQDSDSTSTSCVETLHNFFVTIVLTIYMTEIMVIYLGGLCSWHRLEIVPDLPRQLYAWGACLSQIQVDLQCGIFLGWSRKSWPLKNE